MILKDKGLSFLHKIMILCTILWLQNGFAQGPTINVWYGDNQKFGNNGIPQKWINILGNASDPDGVKSLSYSLDGGTFLGLNLGPDSRRLENLGDFNVELSYSSISENTHSVKFKAEDSMGDTSTITISFIRSNNISPPNHIEIDWNTVSNIQDVCQVVDGKWAIVGDTLRILEPGYDRLVVFGDTSWTYEELTVPITFGSPTGSQAAVGIILHWRGHYLSGGIYPRVGFEWGGLGWYKVGAKQLEIRGHTAEYSVTTAKELLANTTYIFKLRADNIADNNYSYKLKVWQQGFPEPSAWDLENNNIPDGLTNGAPAIVVHNLEADFGDVIINQSDVPLPVTLSQFSANPGESSIVLNWRTESELNNSGFNIYRATKKNPLFKKINNTLIPGAGNSSHPRDYTFIDRDVLPQNIYIYSLESVDFNGKKETQSTIEVLYDPTQVGSNYQLYENYPNPFNNETIIRYELPFTEKAVLRIFNTLGQKIKTLVEQYQSPGTYTVYWDGTDDSGKVVSSGIYFYSLETPQFVRIRKMIFVQ